MKELTLADAGPRLPQVVDEVRATHEPAYLTQAGRRVAAVIDAEDLERLVEAAEDLADIQAGREARAEMQGAPGIPFAVVKRELGLE